MKHSKKILIKFRNVIKIVLPKFLFYYTDLLWKKKLKPKFNKKEKKIVDYEKKFFGLYGKKVIGGPFKGLEYIGLSYYGPLLPKLIGFYELEIQNEIKKFLRKKYKKFIDIGCAEGYYLIGFAMFSNTQTFLGYDISDEARYLCKLLAKKNNVYKKIKIKEACTVEDLRREITQNNLILCDSEGFENYILDPKKIPELKKCDIIVETHDFNVKGVTKSLKKRFYKTHQIKEISATRTYKISDLNKLHFIDKIKKEDINYFLNVRKKSQKYLIMTKKS